MPAASRPSAKPRSAAWRCAGPGPVPAPLVGHSVLASGLFSSRRWRPIAGAPRSDHGARAARLGKAWMMVMIVRCAGMPAVVVMPASPLEATMTSHQPDDGEHARALPRIGPPGERINRRTFLAGAGAIGAAAVAA